MKKRRGPGKPRSPIAKELEKAIYRQRVVPKKGRRREKKDKHNGLRHIEDDLDSRPCRPV